MSTSVGTMRAGSNKLLGPKEKQAKGEKNTASQQTVVVKAENHSSKMQPTQEQLRFAQMMSTNQTDADPNTVKQLMDMTGKSEDVVVIALHDAGNDAERAVMMLLEGGDEQGEWLEQGGKKKKKSTQKENANGEDQSDTRPKERNADKSGDNQDMPPRRGRRNGGPPPRLARGRGRDKGNFGDRDKERNNAAEDWDNEKEDKGSVPRNERDRSGGDRGRSRGRGGFGGRKPATAISGGRGRFNNSNDWENRGFTRPRRFEKMNNNQPSEGPEIDTWTNETAQSNVSNKDTDWNSWNESWVNEEDQWTGTLDETTVFTPSHVKIPEPDPVSNDPPSSLGQRLDVGSLFENAKFAKAPDYSKPSGDSYITQFNQAATESIKNTIGIGSTSRSQIGISAQNSSSSLGLSNLGQSSGQVQGSSVLSPLQQSGTQNPMPHAIAQLSQIQQPTSQGSMSPMAIGSQPSQANSNQAPQQSRIPAVVQQQQNLPQASMNNMQQRPKPQRSKLPPPSKIPSTAVEMPGHIPRNPQLDVQFGLDFGSESSVQFGFGGSGDSTSVTSSYSTSNGTTVISNQLNQGHVSQSAGDGSSVSTIMPSPSAGSSKVPSGVEPQVSNRQGVFHNSVYSSPQSKNESQALERDQNKVNESIPFLSSQLDRKSSPLTSQHPVPANQNLSSGSIASNKDSTSAVANSYSSANGYTASYQTHPKGSISHTTNSQAPQTSSFPGQYPVQSYPSGQTQFPAPPNTTPFPSAQSTPYNSISSQNQFSSGQNQFSVGALAHQSQYAPSAQNSYGNGPSQYSGYQNTSSFPSHPQSQPNYPSNQIVGTGTVLYPTSTQSSVPLYTSQSNSYQSPSSGSFHSSRDGPSNMTVTTQSSSGMSFSSQTQSPNLKPAVTQSSSNYNSQGYNTTPTPLQPSSLANKLGEGLSKISIKDSTTVLDNHQSQYEHTPSAAPTIVSLPSASSSASLSTGTNTISSSSTVTSVSSASRVASMPSTSGKAPPNLPPGVPLMGQYIMGQSTLPPFYSVQPPMYGYEDVQLLQQRMPMQSGSFYDMSAFPAPAGSTGREQQPPIPSVPFSGTSDTKLTRVEAQSPNASSQPQSAHSAAQQPLFNFHYGYYYPSMYPGAAGLQYPTTVYPIPPVTNAAAHPGTTSTTQFQKSYPSHVYTTKGSGTNEITPNAYSKSHGQGFDKQGYHGGTPPPFNLPLATAAQTGPMGAPTTPYGAPFLPVMAAHQPHSQMMHHPIQQDSNSSSSRGLNPGGSQGKSGNAKSFGGPPYWNN